MNTDELYEMFSKMTPIEAARWLRLYVDSGQPDEMNESMTSRAMCRWASMAIEGTQKENMPSCYLNTKYGSIFYFYMWGWDEFLDELKD